MATLFEDTNPRTLKELLQQIHSREMALPDFQRDFVWDPSATQELIVSIAANYPAGSLLRIRNTQNLFACREFQGAPTLGGSRPTYLVLDGQQRLTSLYQAFFGVGEHRYCLNVKSLLAGKEFEECIFHFRTSGREAKSYLDPEYQLRELILPLSELKGGSGGFSRWARTAARRLDGEQRDVLEDSMVDIERTWIQTIDDYQFPVVTLSDSTDAEAVCTIFETLNRTGVRLSAFELLTARFWPHGVNLRQLWAETKETYPLVEDFEVDPYYMLQIIGLTSKKPPTCTRGEILDFEPGLITRWWHPCAAGLNAALTLLRDECGVPVPRWLPYTPMISPLAAILTRYEAMTGPQIGAIRQKIQRWYWCSVFGNTYDNAANSQAALDVAELSAWIEGGPLPRTIDTFRFDPASLRDVTFRQRARYRGVFTLVLSGGARDFHSQQRITGQLMAQNAIDDHHLFPDSYLKVRGVAQRPRECVLNHTLIDRLTNIRISDKAPSRYMGEIAAQIGPGNLDALLASHLLPTGPESPLWSDDFEGFLDYRQSAIGEAISRVTGSA